MHYTNSLILLPWLVITQSRLTEVWSCIMLPKGGLGCESCTKGRLVSSLGNPLKNFFFGVVTWYLYNFGTSSPLQWPLPNGVQTRVPSLLPFPVGKICNNIFRICSHYLAQWAQSSVDRNGWIGKGAFGWCWPPFSKLGESELNVHRISSLFGRLFPSPVS